MNRPVLSHVEMEALCVFDTKAERDAAARYAAFAESCGCMMPVPIWRNAWKDTVSMVTPNGMNKDELWDSVMARLLKAEQSLIMGGYTDCGGTLWRPPLGPAPDSINSLCEKIKNKVRDAHRCQGCGVDEGAEHRDGCPLLRRTQ